MPEQSYQSTRFEDWTHLCQRFETQVGRDLAASQYSQAGHLSNLGDATLVTDAEINISGYLTVKCDQHDGRHGGGTLIYYHERLAVFQMDFNIDIKSCLLDVLIKNQRCSSWMCLSATKQQ